MPRGNLFPDEMAFQLGLLEPRHPSNGRGQETGAQQSTLSELPIQASNSTLKVSFSLLCIITAWDLVMPHPQNACVAWEGSRAR